MFIEVRGLRTQESRFSDLGLLLNLSVFLSRFKFNIVSIWAQFRLLERHEFQEHGGVLAVLHEPALETSNKALAFCRDPLQYFVVGVLSAVQLVVCDIGAGNWVWLRLV